MGRTLRLGSFAVVAAVLVTVLAAWPAGAGAKKPSLTITVRSGRADLVSGGSALVAIALSNGADLSKVKVTAGGRDVSSAFARRGDRSFSGLVDGLTIGADVVHASLSGATGAQITLTNHPSGGPVFSGPQLEPWKCQAGAVDAQCNQAPTYTYLYKSSDPTKPLHGNPQDLLTTTLLPYDPASPPDDVATTTTDQGVTVPFVVRLETGYVDRDQYQIATLFRPGSAWTTFDPQRQFNHKLLIEHGASCGVSHETGGAPSVTGGGTQLNLPNTDAALTALGRGFLTLSTALDNSGHNCNVALQAESLVMAKEHAVKTYGTLRYTIGAGCSGGSLAVQWIANAYPGIYQGLLPTCSFPDAWSTATQFLDYHLLLGYFLDPSKWGPGTVWLPTQMATVMDHLTILNSEVSEQAQFHVAVPTDKCSGVTDAQRYNPATNPGGVRCTIHDAAVNQLGRNIPSRWSPAEQKAGFGFAVPPIDNVGVQYGLGALQSGQITATQFVDLNVKVGGVDIDANHTAARVDAGGEPGLANGYRTGLINEANNLDQTAIIDCRGPDPGLFHDAYRAFALRARLDRAHGSHANQSIWEGPAPIIGDTSCAVNSFVAMDRWLSAVAGDTSASPLARKIVRDKPIDVGDSCYDGLGQKVLGNLCGQAVVPTYGTPRMQAGDDITTDANKCQLKPLNRDNYFFDLGVLKVQIPFTDAQWHALEATFPNGVCDFSKAGVDQQGTIPWQTYQDATGAVIYGGRPLGPPPVSQPVSRS